MNEQPPAAGPGSAASGEHGPPPGPAASTSPLPARGSAVRTVIFSRGAGWAVAAVLAGTVTALAILLAAAPSPSGGVTVMRGPIGRAVFGPGAAKIQMLPGGKRVQIVSGAGPGRRMSIAVPAPGWMGPATFFAGPGQVAVPPGAIHARLMSPFGQVIAGRVGSVSGSTFTLTGPPGARTFTVREQSSTSYRKSGGPAAASAVTKGARVAVLGSLNGTSMTATAVAVLP